MEEHFLILYLGVDYIIPVVDSVNGDMYRFTLDGDLRQWLYFQDDINSAGILYGKKFSQSASVGKEGCYGDYWKCVERHESPVIKGVKTPYVSLVKVSGMLDKIKDWYHKVTNDTSSHIPVYCLFEDAIPAGARKNFLKMLDAEYFEIRAFSVPFNSLLGVSVSGDLSLSEGKQIVIVEAAGRSLHLSSMINSHNEFVHCRESVWVELESENPVKKALVRHIVDVYQRNTNFFTPDALEREYRYHMESREADEWMTRAYETEAGESFSVVFTPSIDRDIRDVINVPKELVVRKQREACEPIVKAVRGFCKDIDYNSVLHYVFTGEMFANRELLDLATQNIAPKVIYRSYTYYPDIIHEYVFNGRGNPSEYVQRRENLADFDDIMRAQDSKRKSAMKWCSNSDKLNDFLGSLEKEIALVESIRDNLAKQIKSADLKVSGCLKTSDFDGAESHLQPLVDERQSIRQNLLVKVNNILGDHKKNMELYKEVSDYKYSEEIVKKIGRGIARLSEAVDGSEDTVGLKGHFAWMDGKQERIDYLRENYEEYKVLRKGYDRESNYLKKKALLAKMRSLTEESLPMDPENLSEILGRVSASVEYKSKMFGLKKVASKLNVIIDIGKGELPYDCVLVISDEHITVIDRRKYCLELPKGTYGIINESIDLPLPQCPNAGRLTLRVLVNEEASNSFVLVDPSKVSFNIEYVNLNEKK